MTPYVFDDRACRLGEGPLWHPERNQLFWFNITENRLLSRTAEGPQEWSFDDNVSAAGWVDHDTLLIASETALWRYSLTDDRRELLVPLEADDPVTRSNDGRADPWGGFWIGTMGKTAEFEAGAIYRYYRGELRQLFDKITVSNAICFTPDRRHAYFTDTPTQLVMRQTLDGKSGWPTGDPEVFLDLHNTNIRPDGAVVDKVGNIWIAKYGGSGVSCYSPDAQLLRSVALEALQTTCPAFGGPNLSTMFCTSAFQNLPAEQLAAQPNNGALFAVDGIGQGQPEHRVIL
ncbi:MAG: SMP-30/gluconolactonase/LRE family protein [Rhodobacteraceae bacterium]|nr:SMP-30/gluconolactonase/LRE family protein [Paracoccaceae bacterium]